MRLNSPCNCHLDREQKTRAHTKNAQKITISIIITASLFYYANISWWLIIITMTRRVLQRCHGMFLAMGGLTRTSFSFPLTSYILLLLEFASLNFLEILFILTHPIHPFNALICFGHTWLSLPSKEPNSTKWDTRPMALMALIRIKNQRLPFVH